MNGTAIIVIYVLTGMGKGGNRVNIEEWLNRGYRIENEIKTLEAERTKAYNALFPVQKYDGIKVQTSSGNSYQQLQDKLLHYEELLDNRIDTLYDTKCEIFQVISHVDNNVFREILILRYISFHRWEEIADGLNYDIRHVFRLHKKALSAAESVYRELFNMS